MGSGERREAVGSFADGEAKQDSGWRAPGGKEDFVRDGGLQGWHGGGRWTLWKPEAPRRLPSVRSMAATPGWLSLT